MHRSRWYVLLFCGLVGVTACNSDSDSDKPKIGNSGMISVASRTDAAVVNVDIGSMLFKGTAFEPALQVEGVVQADPIVVPNCHINFLAKQDVPSEVDGVLSWIGRPLRPGEKMPTDPFEFKAIDPIYDGQEKKTYIRLRVNDMVEAGEPAVFIKDKLARFEVYITQKAEDMAKADMQTAQAQLTYYEKDLELAKITSEKKASALLDLAKSVAQVAIGTASLQGKKEALEKSNFETQAKREKLFQFTISPSLSGQVVNIAKQPGEGIKAGDTIFQIQDRKHLQVEGFIEAQRRGALKDNLPVIIQPTVKVGQWMTMPIHSSNRPITSIAVPKIGGEHWILTAGEDGWVHLWDLKMKRQSFRHKEAVRAIACSSPGVAKPFFVSGCDDGKARIWALDGKAGQTPKEFEGHHAGGVLAVALSPDGKYCATSDEREIYLWDVTTAKKLYTLPRIHIQPVVKLTITPQARLISVGRDNDAIHVWKLGDKNASIERSFEYRTGEVSNLGVTEDGNRMLIDQDQSRLNIVSLGDGSTESSLQIPSESGKFAGMALFSPKLNDKGERVLLTAGQAEGTVQIWKTPSPGKRGSELMDLLWDDGAPATAAAFSSDASKGFVVVGTKRGSVYLWNLPTEEQLTHEYKAVIQKVGGQVESNGRTMKIIAELDNPTDPRWELLPGTNATIVIQP